jgi:hypothetical protein
MTLDSGDKATLTYNGTGSYISIEGGGSAQILRSDVALENGVMHVSAKLHRTKCKPADDRLSIPSSLAQVDQVRLFPKNPIPILPFSPKPLLSSTPLEQKEI